MRSYCLLASALAMGALASPLEKRVMVTEVDLEIVTVTLFVTPGQVIPTQAASGHGYGNGNGHGHRSKHHSKHHSSSSSSTSSPAPAPTQPAPQPTSVYTPPPSSTPTPTPTPAPSSSAAQPSSEAPAPAPSSQAPASGGPSYGVNHVSGEVQATLSSGSGSDYENAMLWHHNRARALHGADNLQWSQECAAAAKTAAEFCDFVHHTVDGQGQNLFTVSGNAFNATAGVTESWYKGEADAYHWWGQEPPHSSENQLDMETFEKYGHLTQLAWKSTTSVGCHTVDCGSSMKVSGVSSSMNKYTVCNYSPPGNWPNKFADNVAAPAGSYAGFRWSD